MRLECLLGCAAKIRMTALPCFRDDQHIALSCYQVKFAALASRFARDDGQARRGGVPTLAQPTVHRWLKLLETSYLLVRLPACAVHRTKRLTSGCRSR